MPLISSLCIKGHCKLFVNEKNFEYLTNLRKLTIDKCTFIGSFEHLSSIKSLSLTMCRGFDESHLSKVPKLETLHIDRCYFTGKSLTSLVNLKSFAITKCGDFYETKLEKLTKLEK